VPYCGEAWREIELARERLKSRDRSDLEDALRNLAYAWLYLNDVKNVRNPISLVYRKEIFREALFNAGVACLTGEVEQLREGAKTLLKNIEKIFNELC